MEAEAVVPSVVVSMNDGDLRQTGLVKFGNNARVLNHSAGGRLTLQATSLGDYVYRS